METMSRFFTAVRGRGLSVVLPEGEEPRILQAARRVVDETLARPILLGAPQAVAARAREVGCDLAARLQQYEVLRPPISTEALKSLKRVGRAHVAKDDLSEHHTIEQPRTICGIGEQNGELDAVALRFAEKSCPRSPRAAFVEGGSAMGFHLGS